MASEPRLSFNANLVRLKVVKPLDRAHLHLHSFNANLVRLKAQPVTLTGLTPTSFNANLVRLKVAIKDAGNMLDIEVSMPIWFD